MPRCRAAALQPQLIADLGQGNVRPLGNQRREALVVKTRLAAWHSGYRFLK
jgi:hypothetical protein